MYESELKLSAYNGSLKLATVVSAGILTILFAK